MLGRILPALLLTLILAAPAFADDRPGRDTGDRWDALSQAQHDRALARAERHGLFSHFNYTAANGTAQGRFARLTLQPSTGGITSFAVRGRPNQAWNSAIDSVTASHFTANGTPAAKGSVLRMDGTEFGFTAHDNPTAGMMWHAAQNTTTTLTFTLAKGDQILSNTSRELKFSFGTMHGHIASNGDTPLQVTATADKRNITATVTLHGGDSALFRAHPTVGAETLHDELAAFEARKLGATLRITDAGGAAAEDGDEVDVQASTREIAHGHVVWDISSAQHEGRLFFLVLDNETFDLSRLDAFAASLNGTAVRRAASAAEAENAADAAFAVVAAGDKGTVTIVVHVSHFSAYALTLTQVAAGSSSTTSGSGSTSSGSATGGATASSTAPKGTPGLALPALLVGLAAALVVARRRAD
jgi:hypothetical protein